LVCAAGSLSFPFQRSMGRTMLNETVVLNMDTIHFGRTPDRIMDGTCMDWFWAATAEEVADLERCEIMN
jgi:hypothetical protein